MILLGDTKMRWFDIGDILTVTTGVMVSPRHLPGIYDMLSYMADDEPDAIMPHLLKISDLAERTLLTRYPTLSLAHDEARSLPSNDQMRIWTARYGESLAVPKLSVQEITSAKSTPS